MSFDKLKGKMVEERISQEKLAKAIGITVQSLNAKLNGRSKFTLDEALMITQVLRIENPADIFFANKIPNMQQKDKEVV